jgi:hypothetical protein
MIQAGELGCTFQMLLITYPIAVAICCLNGSRIRIWPSKRVSAAH